MKTALITGGVEPTTQADIAQTVPWIASRPSHLNVNRLEILPVNPSPAGQIVRQEQS